MRISKGIAISKIHLILVVLEGVLPAEGEVSLQDSSALREAILIILDVFAHSMPTQIVGCGFVDTVGNDTHARQKQTALFVHVENIKTHFSVSMSVGNLEEEPLTVA